MNNCTASSGPGARLVYPATEKKPGRPRIGCAYEPAVRIDMNDDELRVQRAVLSMRDHQRRKRRLIGVLSWAAWLALCAATIALTIALPSGGGQ